MVEDQGTAVGTIISILKTTNASVIELHAAIAEIATCLGEDIRRQKALEGRVTELENRVFK